MLPSAILLTVFGIIGSVQAAPNSNGVEFLFPTDGLTLNYLDTINVTYTSPFPKPLLYTFCTNKTDTKKLIQKELIQADPFNASHLFTLNYKDVSSCYWNLRPNTSTGFGGNSFPVKLLTDGESKTTISLPTGTQPSSTESPPTSEPTAGNGSGGTGSPASGGLSTGAKAGIGAGVGVVALAALAGLVFWLLRRRRANQKGDGEGKIHEAPGSEGSTFANHTNSDGAGGGYYSSDQQNAKSQGEGGAIKWGGPKVGELPGDSGQGNGQVYEMSGDARIAEAPANAVNR